MELALGIAFLNAGEYEKALRLLETAWVHKNTLELAKSLSFAAFMSENFGRSEFFAKILSDQYGDSRTAYDLLGSIYLIQDRIQQSLIYWNQIGKPVLYDIVWESNPRFIEVLSKAIPVYKGKILRLNDFNSLCALLQRLNFVRDFKLLLIPRGEKLFDLRIQIKEKPHFFETPLQFFIDEAINALQSQFQIEWNDIAHSRSTIGLLHRYENNRKASSIQVAHSLGFGTNSDFHLSLLSRNETWFPFSQKATSVRQNIIQAEAEGEIFGGINDGLGFFYKENVEQNINPRRYFGNSARKRFYFFGGKDPTASARFDFGFQWEIKNYRPTHAYLSVFLSTYTKASVLGGRWKGSVQYSYTQFPDLSDYLQIGIGPGIRYLMRAHSYQLNKDIPESAALISKNFLLANSQFEKEILPRSLITVKAFIFWDCFYRFDRFRINSPSLINDVGFGFDVGFLSRRIGTLCCGYNLEKRSLSIYLGQCWDWN